MKMDISLMKLDGKKMTILFCVGLLLFGALLENNMPVRWHMIMGLGFFLIGVVCVAYVHELAHFLVAKKIGVNNAVMHTSLKGFYVTYHTAAPVKRIVISAAGPLCGLCLGTAGLALAAAIQDGETLAATWLGLVSVVACLQGVFLMPFVQDGAVLWASVIDVITSKGVSRETE